MSATNPFRSPSARGPGHARGGVWLRVVAALALTGGLGACGGGGDTPSDDGRSSRGENGTYLFLSRPRLYFGTRDVGTTRVETLEIENRGADVYPLEAIRLSGNDVDDFRTPFYGEVVLQPTQALRVPVTFAPLADGRKFASLDIDYDTIVKVAPEVNEAEQAYYAARTRARSGQYAAAEDGWKDYLAGEPVTVNERRAALRVPIAMEAQTYASGEDATLYLEALDARDRDAPAEAMAALDLVVERHADGYLADDATYLRGYVALMDMDDPEAALREFRNLAERWPDSTYRDTATYAEAIAQERLGNDLLAAELYEALRARHTGIDALGVRLPKDELVSRLWFARADAALEALRGD